MGYKKFLGMGYEKFLKLDLIYSQEIIKRKSPTPATVQCSSQEFLIGEAFPGNSMSTFSPDFPVKDS